MDARILSQIFGVIRRVPLIGSALRWVIRQYPEGSVVRIWSGAAKNLHWKRFHRYDPAFWLGTYEPPIQQFLQEHLRPGDVFYDVGANAGFFTVLAAHLVGYEGCVVAFEPHPDNARSIADQIEVNGFKNVVLIEKAVSSGAGRARFCAGNNLSRGHLGIPVPGEMAVDVEAIGLDDLLKDVRPPTLLKVDIEGGGVEFVKGARMTAERHRPIWVLEVHNREEETAFKRLLLPLDYRFESLDGTPIPVNGSLLNHVVAFCNS